MYEEVMKENYESTKKRMTDHYYEKKGEIWAEAERRVKEETLKYETATAELDRAYNITLESYRKVMSR